MEYTTYISKSDIDNKYYYGSTVCLERRLSEHNQGKVPATKHRRLLHIHYFEIYRTRYEAVSRELFFKKRSGYKWLKNNNII